MATCAASAAAAAALHPPSLSTCRARTRLERGAHSRAGQPSCNLVRRPGLTRQPPAAGPVRKNGARRGTLPPRARRRCGRADGVLWDSRRGLLGLRRCKLQRRRPPPPSGRPAAPRHRCNECGALLLPVPAPPRATRPQTAPAGGAKPPTQGPAPCETEGRPLEKLRKDFRCNLIPSLSSCFGERSALAPRPTRGGLSGKSSPLPHHDRGPEGAAAPSDGGARRRRRERRRRMMMMAAHGAMMMLEGPFQALAHTPLAGRSAARSRPASRLARSGAAGRGRAEAGAPGARRRFFTPLHHKPTLLSHGSHTAGPRAPAHPQQWPVISDELGLRPAAAGVDPPVCRRLPLVDGAGGAGVTGAQFGNDGAVRCRSPVSCSGTHAAQRGRVWPSTCKVAGPGAP
eukprot:scaffold60_cov382-Prasinococcus_capsulatus_cf.AAC.4